MRENLGRNARARKVRKGLLESRGSHDNKKKASIRNLERVERVGREERGERRERIEKVEREGRLGRAGKEWRSQRSKPKSSDGYFRLE